MKIQNKVIVFAFACSLLIEPVHAFHPFLKWSAALVSLVGGGYVGNKAYQEYRFMREKRNLSHAQRQVLLTIEELGNDCKLFKEHAARQRLEEVLKQRFTTKDGTDHSSPSIGAFQAHVKTFKNKHETIDESYRDKAEDWKDAEARYKNMVPAVLKLIADNEHILKQVQQLDILVGQGVPFVSLLILYTQSMQATKELRQARDTQAAILNRYRDPHFPYPFIKCVKELQETQQELLKGERALQTTGKASTNLAYESAALRTELEKILRSINDQFYKQQEEQGKHEYRLREVQALEQQAKIANDRLQEERRKNDLKQAEVMTNATIIAECREQVQVQKRNIQMLEGELSSLRKALDLSRRDELRIQQELNSVKEKLASFEGKLNTVPVNPETLDKDIREWWQGLQSTLAALRLKLDSVKRGSA